MRRVLSVLAVLLGLLGAASVPLMAQGGLDVSPTQVQVTAVRGESHERTLMLRATTPLTRVTVIPADLAHRQGSAVLPSSAILVTSSPADMAVNTLRAVPITFNLHDVPSGQYVGDLLVSYEGGSRPIPVTVAVKDPPWAPLAVLTAGVMLGVGVSNYRAKGRERDEILVRLGQIRTRIKLDQELQERATPLLDSLMVTLEDVETELEAQQWQGAAQAMQRARDQWRRWRENRSDWLEHLAYYERFIEELEALVKDGPKPFVDAVLLDAQRVYRALSSFEKPEELGAKLNPLYEKIKAYSDLSVEISRLPDPVSFRQRLDAMSPDDATGLEELRQQVQATLAEIRVARAEHDLDELNHFVETLPREDATLWRERLEALQVQLRDVASSDASTYSAFSGRMQALFEQGLSGIRGFPKLRLPLEEEGAQPARVFTLNGPRLQVKRIQDVDTSSDSRKKRPSRDAIADAQLRLRLFRWVTYAVAVILLAMAGYVELYVGRIDFGVNGVGDFFPLLAWGFGAEATRSAIVDLFQGWGILH